MSNSDHDIGSPTFAATLHGVTDRGRRSNRRTLETLRLGIAAAAVLLWLPTTAYLTLADSVPRALHSGLNSQLGHVVMGLAVTATALVLLRMTKGGRRPSWPSVVAVVAGSSLFLLTTEVLQSLTATRTPSLIDMMADMTGVAVSTFMVAGPFEPSWILPLRRGLTIPVLGVVTACSLVATVATQPAQPRIRTGMAMVAGGCIEQLVHPADPRSGNEARAASAPTPSLSAVTESPLLALDLSDVDRDVIESVGADGPVVFDVTSGSDGGPGPSTEGGLAFDGGAMAVRSQESVDDLVESLDVTEAFTIAMVFTPETLDQDGPTRLMTISEGKQPPEINLQIGIERDWLSLRIRSDCDVWNWMALSALPPGEIRLVAVYDEGTIDAYINGRHTGHAVLEMANVGSWDLDYPLTIGNEVTSDRGYLGTISCITVWDEAADPADAIESSTTRPC